MMNTKLRYKKISMLMPVVLCIVVVASLLVISNQQRDQPIVPELLLPGAVGSPFTGSNACTDAALTYIGCNIYNPSSKSLSSVVIAWWDVGLTGLFHRYLEMDQEGKVDIDIVKYLTTSARTNPFTDAGSMVEWGSSGHDSTLGELGHTTSVASYDHAVSTLSALATIAKNIKIVFIDMWDSVTNRGYFGHEDYLWDWLIANSGGNGLDIDIFGVDLGIDITGFEQYYDNILPKIQTLKNNNVMLLGATGNSGSSMNAGLDWPQFTDEFLAIGSIDHETRSTGITSTQDQRSYFSSWGSQTSETTGVNWLMPGSGVPIVDSSTIHHVAGYFLGNWQYGAGTSYSLPYFAGATAVIFDAYMDGRATHGGGRSDPTYSTVISILQTASSQSSWNYLTGRGIVSLNDLYTTAYDAGWNSYTPPLPPCSRPPCPI